MDLGLFAILVISATILLAASLYCFTNAENIFLTKKEAKEAKEKLQKLNNKNVSAETTNTK